MEGTYLNLNLQVNLAYRDDFEAIIPYVGEIQMVDESGQVNAQLGTFRLTHIADYNSQLMDDYSGEYNELDIAVRSLRREDDEMPLSLWYLERLVVKPDFRGHGIGTQTVQRLMRYASAFSFIHSMFVVYAAPLDEEGQSLLGSQASDANDVKEKLGQLYQFYTRLGLEFLPSSHPIRSLNSPEPEPLWFYYDLEKNLPAWAKR